MSLQNRVKPDGSIVATPDRGDMMGNRGGAFHDDNQNLLDRHWRSKQWICCLLAFENRRRRVMQPSRYTELFFLDEVTALAAGHRPCFECRRAAALDFARRWNAVRGLAGRATAPEMDRVLHRERLTDGGCKRIYAAELMSLPDNAVVRLNGRIARIVGNGLQDWSFAGYGARYQVGEQREVTVLTPPSIIAVLGAGYAPVLHKSAAS